MLNKGVELLNWPPPKPDEGALNGFDPKAGMLCWKPVDCPKGDVCPIEGVDKNNPDDCVLPNERPVPNEEADPIFEEPKIEVEEPKAGALPLPKIGVEVLEPNTEVLGAPNNEGVEDAAPKGLDEAEEKGELKIELDEDPKPVEPKAGVLGAKGLDEVADEKGFAAG